MLSMGGQEWQRDQLGCRRTRVYTRNVVASAERRGVDAKLEFIVITRDFRQEHLLWTILYSSLAVPAGPTHHELLSYKAAVRTY